MERRQFINKSALATAALCTCAIGIDSCTMISGISDTPVAPENSFSRRDNEVVVKLANIPSLAVVGGSAKFSIAKDNDKPLKIIIARTGTVDYCIFADKCTHGGRELTYNHEDKIMQCTSFGHSKFDMKGNVLGGPAHDTLKKYTFLLKDNELYFNLA